MHEVWRCCSCKERKAAHLSPKARRALKGATDLTMPIRGLRDFLNERRLVQTSDISALNTQRIGVDGQVWMKKLPLQEPFHVAIGGTPQSINTLIQHELQKFTDAGIKPTFIFNGLNLVRKDRAFARSDGRSQRMANAWEAYYKNQLETATFMFQDSEKNISLPFIHNVLKYFKDHNIEYFRAPYLTWSQLAWLAPPKQNFIDATFGGLELLLYGVLRLIVDIDFERKTFDWVDTKSVLLHLSLSSDEFLDACVLAGFDYCVTFPPLLEQQFTFRNACEMVKNFKTGYAAVRQFATHANVQKLGYMDLFLRARAIVRHHPVYTTSCVCEPLMRDSSPSDLHDVVGPRLPNDLYFLLSQGIVLPQVLNNLTTGVLLEAPPNVDSEEYRRMLNELTDLREKTLGLLTGVLHDQFSIKRITSARWYDFSTEYEPQKITYLRNLQSTGYRVPHSEIAAELARLNRGDAVSISSVVAVQAARGSATPTASESGNPDVLTNPSELSYTILLHLLVMREFLTSDPQHLPTYLGKSLEDVSPNFQEEALLILELIKYNYITSTKLTLVPPAPTLTHPPSSTPTEDYEKKEVIFISRIVSVLPMHLNDQPWNGALDHDLMGFHEIVKALYRSLRNALEMTLASLFLSHKTQLAPQEYTRVAFSLPFFQQNSTAMGIVVKHFLIGNESVANLQSKFPNCTDLAGDIKSAYAFWAEIMKITSFLNECIVLPAELLAQFTSADTFFQSRRHLL
eukprot:Phypoly_transcript_02717.p1 GENE.Phypoly_transcript_02717~~Phypoly_transcript_02717.p1  ORF type:complete len:741 (+),score=127.90 Phypoly_transcript_02717:53-2275(+)